MADVLQPQEGKIIINNMPIILRSIDRTMKAVNDWWNALQTAESVYFPNRQELYDIFSTVEIDAHLTGIIDKRIRNTVNKKLYFKKDDTKVDALDVLADSEEFKEMRKERFKCLTHGLYGFEFIPGATFDFNCIPIKHIDPVSKMIMKEQWGSEGFSYEGIWNIVVEGEPNCFGILNKCAPLVLWKKGVMGDWAQFIEIFGQPFIMFLYNGYDEKTKKELDEALGKMGSGTKMQLPKEIEPKVFDGKQSNGDGGLQDRFRVAINEELSVLILGVTETTASSKSSGFAQSQTHLLQQDEVIKDDMDDELNFLNSPQMLQIFKSYGFPVDGGEWCYEDEVDLDELKKKVDIIMTVAKRQPIDDDYVYDITNIPKPTNYDQLKNEMTAAQQMQQQQMQQDPSQQMMDPSQQGKQMPPQSQGAARPSPYGEGKGMRWLKKLAAFFAEAR